MNTKKRRYIVLRRISKKEVKEKARRIAKTFPEGFRSEGVVLSEKRAKRLEEKAFEIATKHIEKYPELYF